MTSNQYENQNCYLLTIYVKFNWGLSTCEDFLSEYFITWDNNYQKKVIRPHSLSRLFYKDRSISPASGKDQYWYTCRYC